MTFPHNARFDEAFNVVPGFVPKILQTGASNGDYVSLKNYVGCGVIFFAAAGTAGDDPTITLDQATAVAGTGTKPLVAISRVAVKQGADLAAVGTYTIVEQTAAATYTDATSAELQKLWVFDIKHGDLDIDGGFDCFRASVSDVGTNAQLGTLLYIPYGPRHTPLLSAIVD